MMTLIHRFVIRRAAAALAVAAAVVWCSTPASAQLDPLGFLKRVPPTVVVAVDTSFWMQTDVNGHYFDPNFYSSGDDVLLAQALGIDTLKVSTYRRVYRNIQREAVQDANSKFAADDIVATPMIWNPAQPATSNAPSDLAFLNPTRLSIAKRGVSLAVSENASALFRWGLVKMRQDTPEWSVSPKCDKPLRLLNHPALAAFGDTNPCNAGGPDKFAIYAPTVNSSNFSIEGNGALGSPVVVATGPNAAPSMLHELGRALFDPLALIPAGRGTSTYADRPIAHLLDDARAAAVTAMTGDSAADRACRNTVVVLITSGKDAGDPGYDAAHDAPAVASTFQTVSGGGVTKRVPIYVIGLNPPAGDVAELQSIADNSGGRYFTATDAASVARYVNLAVQAGFSRPTEFDSGISSEFTPVSPIVGTVNIKGGRDANGASLPYDDIFSPDNQHIPQRSNLLLTAGFALPGFDGRLRAFRTYKPEADATKPSGYKFVKDGTRLWPDLDGRPQYAGLARPPADSTKRNIYTYIPDGAGGGNVVAFTVANAATIAPHLALTGTGLTAAGVISALRGAPIGAVIGSTPAIMDAPSLDPPPDTDYGRPDGGATFAGQHKDRRSLIFFGANDGMIHCVDARTGFEVWAFIPYNLLPKLRTLFDGQPVDQFDFFVDSSPKMAEVKMIMPDASHQWRSLLIIGEGPGGVFYQAFDVTEAGMGVAPDLDDLNTVDSLLGLFDTPEESIDFLWSFPNYTHFDTAYTATFTVTDGTPGGKVKIFGDVSAAASLVEKSVGFAWSDPAVGPLNVDRTVNAVMVGSGYFPAIEDSIPTRGAASPRAGRSFYLLKVEDGTPLGNPGGNACAGTGCFDVGEIAANGRKNALQADPTAAGITNSHVVTKAYIGDIDGKYWRLNLADTGVISKFELVDAAQPIYASSALLFVGSADQYAFFSTGSDLLPASAPGGTGTFKLYGLKDNYPGAAQLKFTRDLAMVTNVGGLANGERPSTSPSVAGDIVFYTTTSENAAAPCGDFAASLYALTYLGGAAYDTDNNAKMDVNESPVIKTVAGRATAPFIVDQHLYFGSAGAAGANVEVFGDPEDFNNGVGQVGVRILSWREIR